MTTTSTTDIRSRREQLGVSRLRLAVRAGVSPAWVQALEAGLRPVGGTALEKVEVALAAFEVESLGPEWQLTPGLGRSGYRGDTTGPEAA